MSCESCEDDGKSGCIRCSEDHYMTLDHFCELECTAHTYKSDPETRECLLCNELCGNCTGPGETLRKGEDCTTCPDTYYEDEVPNCEPCDKTCKTCE